MVDWIEKVSRLVDEHSRILRRLQATVTLLSILTGIDVDRFMAAIEIMESVEGDDDMDRCIELAMRTLNRG